MTNNLNKPFQPVYGGKNMRWIVTNQINKTKRTFPNKTEAMAHCKRKALEFEKAQKLLGYRRKVGFEAPIAKAESEDGTSAFETRVRVTVLRKDGTPDKWKILFD